MAAAIRAVIVIGPGRSLGVLLALAAAAAFADTDDAPPPAAAPTGPLSLTLAQQEAVGIRIERPLALRAPVEIEAFGTVLDPLHPW